MATQWLRQGNSPADISILEPTGQAHAKGIALLRLGCHLFEREHILAAEELFTAAVGCGDDALLPEGRARLGIVRLAQQRFDQSADLLQLGLAQELGGFSSGVSQACRSPARPS